MAIGQKNIVELSGGKDGADKGKGTPPPKPKSAPSPTEDRDLRGRLASIFERIADAADARGDTELADIVREDMQVMSTGLVSLTRPFRMLRTPIIMMLGIVEPVMAFSRITRLMLDRLLERRADKRADNADENDLPPIP